LIYPLAEDAFCKVPMVMLQPLFQVKPFILKVKPLVIYQADLFEGRSEKLSLNELSGNKSSPCEIFDDLIEKSRSFVAFSNDFSPPLRAFALLGAHSPIGGQDTFSHHPQIAQCK